MHVITTEKLVIMGDEHPHIFSPQRAKIRIDDQGAGPYLVISGHNDEPESATGEAGHEFFLCSDEEIDRFADICREMLLEAQVNI